MIDIPPPILRMRCLRCGNWHSRDVADPYLPMLCGCCFSKGLEILNERPPGAFERWCVRWQRGQESNPFYRAFVASYDAWVAARFAGEAVSP